MGWMVGVWWQPWMACMGSMAGVGGGSEVADRVQGPHDDEGGQSKGAGRLPPKIRYAMRESNPVGTLLAAGRNSCTLLPVLGGERLA